MRIIGRIPHPTLAITVFSNDGRFPVQFETGGLSQIYRFRHSDTLRSLADVQRLVDEDFVAAVLEQFQTMRRVHARALSALAPPDDGPTDGLPTII